MSQEWEGDAMSSWEFNFREKFTFIDNKNHLRMKTDLRVELIEDFIRSLLQSQTERPPQGLVKIDGNVMTDMLKNATSDHLEKMGYDFHKPDEWPKGFKAFYMVFYSIVRTFVARFGVPVVKLPPMRPTLNPEHPNWHEDSIIWNQLLGLVRSELDRVGVKWE